MHSALQKTPKNAIRYASRIAKYGPSPSSVIPFAKNDRNNISHPNAMHYTIHYAALSEKKTRVFPCPQTAAFSCHRRQNFERLFSTMYLYTKKHKHHYVIDSLQHHFDYYRSFSYPWNYLFSFSFVKDHFMEGKIIV
jgi:hypothetical protein